MDDTGDGPVYCSMVTYDLGMGRVLVFKMQDRPFENDDLGPHTCKAQKM